MTQRPEIQKMQARLRSALSDAAVLQLVRGDLLHTFSQLGLKQEAPAVIERMLATLRDTTDIEATEAQIYAELQQLRVGTLSLTQILDAKMQQRAAIIYGQVAPFFKSDATIIDWGCGDGQVTNLIAKHITHKIEGYDVRKYPAPGLAISITQFDGQTIPVGFGHFEAGLMTNVAHHEVDNSRILRELSRIIRSGGRLVVIETVPIKDDPTEFERTFIGDYVYNRLFHQSDIPVPGTYETEAGWVKRFAAAGFELEKFKKITNPTPLGYDQPTIRDWHTRLVFRRQ